MWINNSEFLIKDSEVPTTPVKFSLDAKEWYKEQKRRCIEGYWVGGKYMPPQLYFYVNFWNILLNKGKSKSKIISKPWLRDVEWELFPSYLCARGLSGFDGNLNVASSAEHMYEFLKNNNKSFGCPQYDNEATDLMVMTARETGKSFIASVLVAHEWLFNGQKNYLLPSDENFQKTTANITVGAGDSKFSSRLLVKVKMGLDILASQGIEFAGRYYPHPFFQSYNGSWSPGKQIVAKYKKKVGGTWQEVGSMSTINHVSYKDNDYAAQGSRNSLMIKEEIGMFSNLEEAREADKETMMSGTNKYGTCVYIGTGGDMERGTLAAYKMFYAPEVYDIMSFEDRWEQKGKIGLFIPATMRPNEFKDEQGNTKYDVAVSHFESEREKLRNSKNGSAPLNAYIQYNPITPSEVFLRTNVNIFPVSEIKEWLADLEVKQIYQDAEMVCELIFDEDGNIKPSINKDLNAVRDFPLEKEKDSNGAVVIFHHPDVGDDGQIPYGRYIAGIDPYDADKSTTSSLGSIIVMDRLSNRVVAEYSGRPRFADMFYENCRRLLLYYNAIALYENEKMGVKQYFERKKCLHLLMRQPQYIKDVIPNSTVERGFGMHMNVALKDHGEILARDWLQEEYEPGKLSLRKIRSVPVLKEMILYDSDNGNFDRVMAFIMCMYALQELHKQKVIYAEDKAKSVDPFFKRRLNQKSYTPNALW